MGTRVRREDGVQAPDEGGPALMTDIVDDMSTDPAPDLPAAQDQMLSHLAARLRLGESLFTVSTGLMTTVGRLEAAGYVTVMNGISERTVRASLTEKGIGYALSPTYEPPVAKLHKRGAGGWCDECNQRFPCRTRRMLMPNETI
jgi:hypothetical protein